MHSDHKQSQKHDAHVRTAFIHFFPFKIFLSLIFLVFLIGLLIGNLYGYISCQAILDVSMFYK